GLEYLDLRTEDSALLEQPGFAVLPAVEPDTTSAEPETVPEFLTDKGAETTSGATEPGGAETQIIENAEETPTEIPPAEPSQLDPEAEAKRIARQRDRDIKAILRQLIDELIAEYARDDRGIEIREIAGGYRMATKPECHDAVRMFIKSLKPAL